MAGSPSPPKKRARVCPEDELGDAGLDGIDAIDTHLER